jgi:hypothetical protein
MNNALIMWLFLRRRDTDKQTMPDGDALRGALVRSIVPGACGHASSAENSPRRMPMACGGNAGGPSGEPVPKQASAWERSPQARLRARGPCGLGQARSARVRHSSGVVPCRGRGFRPNVRSRWKQTCEGQRRSSRFDRSSRSSRCRNSAG